MRSPEAVAEARAIADRVAPIVMGAEQRIEVLPALHQLLPHGLQRGTTVGVAGPARLSLGLAVAAGAAEDGAWMATVGCDELCLAGAEQVGVALDRLVLVEQPPRSSWGAVVAALVDAFDIVVMDGHFRARSRDARRLSSRARERGSVIVDVGGVWPEAHDTMLHVVDQQWTGLGSGHGVLTARHVSVTVSGRRGVRPRQVPLWLPGPDAVPAAAVEAVETSEPSTFGVGHAGADIDALVAVDADPQDLRRVG